MVKSMNRTLNKMQHIFQPNGISCGPTSLKMVAEMHGCAHGTDVLMLSDLMGIDSLTGTTDERMVKGLKGVGLDYVEHNPGSIESLIQALQNDSTVLLRTSFSGMKHWIVASRYVDNGKFEIYDPAQGVYEFSAEQVTQVWEPRNYQAFEIPKEQDSSKFLSICTLEGLKQQAIELACNAFQHIVPRESVPPQLLFSMEKISIGLLIGERIIGAYFLDAHKMWEIKDDDLVGIQGDALVVIPEYQGYGYGSLLRAIPSRMPGVDYIWGMQHKGLNNIDDWLKRRIMFKDMNSCFITVEPLTAKARATIQYTIDNPPPPPVINLENFRYSFTGRHYELDDTDLSDLTDEERQDIYNDGYEALISKIEDLLDEVADYVPNHAVNDIQMELYNVIGAIKDFQEDIIN